VLVVAGVAKDLKEGLAKAAKSVDSKAALKKLDGLVKMTTNKGTAKTKAKGKG
jgi:anthranilate phosphoribosyltransferase